MNPDNGVPLSMSKYDKFADNANFIPRSFSWVDPQKEMLASIHGMQNGLISYQDVQSNYGRDVEELFEQHEREQRLAEQYGIKTAFQPFGEKQAVEPEVIGDDNVVQADDGMKSEARKGLDWRKEHGRGGTEVGISRARDIVNNKNLSADTVKRMYSFSRHELTSKQKVLNKVKMAIRLMGA